MVFLGIVGACLGACAVGVALIALGVARRSQARCEGLESSVAALRREFELVASISARTGRRVQRIEHDYSEVAERVDRVESHGSNAGAGSLDQAIDWARRGADPDKLSQEFGISPGEAELLARLHGHKKSA